MADFYSPTSQTLFDNIEWLPQEGAEPASEGRPPNSYAVLMKEGSILVDAAHPWTMGGVNALTERGHRPVAIVFTHAHAASDATAVGELVRTYGAPVMMHPADASAVGAAGAGVTFEDPKGSALLKEAGLDVIPMPYHTPGSIMLAMEYHRGILFTGDAAIAPGPLQAPEPPRLERPSVPPQKDDDFRKDWEVICAQRHFSSVLPRHGTPYTDRVDMHQIMRKLWDSAPMTPGEPAAAGQRVRAAGVDG